MDQSEENKTEQGEETGVPEDTKDYYSPEEGE